MGGVGKILSELELIIESGWLVWGEFSLEGILLLVLAFGIGVVVGRRVEADLGRDGVFLSEHLVSTRLEVAG